jgi:hypothetical protein
LNAFASQLGRGHLNKPGDIASQSAGTG